MTTGPRANVNSRQLVISSPPAPPAAPTYTELGGEPGAGNCTNSTLADPATEVVNFGVWSGAAAAGDNRYCRLLITLQ
ncbi:MAG: hypothetical protein V9G12_02755 [Microthrixaceae bacterium]